ncbi:hypothetical protein PRZ48_007718 [Zasmidium cellare]|uniref:Uncharacterized protein n=1 Tax=Zasmidium cellare TaxID=395010 RepID=A0ABR0EK23_ZASCE|nr:hypothetical protein PRZ48_007718 [Zasmidium cellare]
MSSTQETVLNDQERMYHELDKTMMQANHSNDYDKAISTAHTLISADDVPLHIYARACMVLGGSDEDDFLIWAEEAMRIGEEIAGEDPELAENCREVYDEAMEEKARLEAQLRASGWEEQGGDREGEEEEKDE